MAGRSAAAGAATQPVVVPVKPSVSSGTTTGPLTPAAPAWMWDATAGAMLVTVMFQHTCRVTGSMVMVAVPEPSGSPGGVSADPPLSVAVKVVLAARTAPADISPRASTATRTRTGVRVRKIDLRSRSAGDVGIAASP